MKLLRIDGSSRIQQSESRKMADYFVNHWKAKYPETEIITRNIIEHPIPHISQKTIEGFYTDPANLTNELKEALTTSDTLIQELMESDLLLLSTPMYNFGLPSAVKAWIDHIVRINKTFGVAEDHSFYGMTKNSKAYIITSAGAVYSNEQMQHFDFLSPYLKTVLGLIGITDVHFISLEGTTLDPNFFSTSSLKAKQFIEQL